jgi:hypothetical protein
LGDRPVWGGVYRIIMTGCGHDRLVREAVFEGVLPPPEDGDDSTPCAPGGLVRST